MQLRSRTPSPTKQGSAASPAKRATPKKVGTPSKLSPTKHTRNLVPVCGWKAWILWNSELRKWVTEKTTAIERNQGSGAASKAEVVKPCLDIVSRLGHLIPGDERAAQLLTENLESFTMVTIAQETKYFRDEGVSKTQVQILFSSDDEDGLEISNNTKILNTYAELGELSHLLFRVGDIVLLKDYATVGDEHIFLNNSSQESRCQILYLMNQELDEPTDFRVPFGTQEWNSHMRGWVKYFYVKPFIERGSQRCTLLRIVPQPQLRQSLSGNAQPCASTSSGFNSQVISELVEARAVRAARKRNTSSSAHANDANNRENDTPRNREETPQKRRRIKTGRAAEVRANGESEESTELSQESQESVIEPKITMKAIDQHYRASFARRAKTNIRPITPAPVPVSDNEGDPRTNDVQNNAFINYDEDDDDDVIPPLDPDYEIDEDEDSKDEYFNHFDENTRSRKAFTKRRYSNRVDRVDVPLEGGFIRDRLNESFEEEEHLNVTNTPSKQRDKLDWHSGMRPKLTKAKSYQYKTLAELENELLAEVEKRMIKNQENVYGVVTSTKHLEKGNFHTFLLRIMDDSGKQDVLVRLCTTAHDPKVGPKPHPNDIIRIHRACVQFEGAEMVISAAPHHSYTLFNYEDTLIDEIEIATSAHTIHYTDADKKRIIDLRGFVKQSIRESAFDDSVQIEDASQSQDDDGRSRVGVVGQVNNHEVNEDVQNGQDHVPGGQVEMEQEHGDAGGGAINEEPADLHSSEVVSHLSGTIETEIRSQSEGFGGEINYNMRYPLDRTIIYETMHPDGCCLLEQLTKDQPEFNMKFWMLKSTYNLEQDICIARVADGTKSQFHRFVKLSHESEEEVEIKSYALCETRPEDARVYAPVVDVEILNLSKNEALAESLMTMVVAGRVRYVLKHVKLVDQPGPFTRKFKHVKLVVDALNTELMTYELYDKFTDMEIGDTRNQAKASPSTSKSVSLPAVEEQSKHDTIVAFPSDSESTVSTRTTRSRSRSQLKTTSSEDSSDKPAAVAQSPPSSVSVVSSSEHDDSQSSYHTANTSSSQSTQRRGEALDNIMEVDEETDDGDHHTSEEEEVGEVEMIAGRNVSNPVVKNRACGGQRAKSPEGLFRRSMRLFFSR